MIFMETEFREARGRALVGMIEQDALDAAPRYAQLAQTRALYNGTATAMMPLPWAGASNIHIPLLQEKTETLVPILSAAFWGVEPVVNVQRSSKEYYEEQTDTVERAINFFVRKDIPDMFDTFENWQRDTGRDGLGIVKVYWSREDRNVSEFHDMKLAYVAGDTTPNGLEIEEPRMKTELELLTEKFGAPDAENGLIDAAQVFMRDEETFIGNEWIIRFTEGRRIYDGHITFMGSEFTDELILRVRRRIVHREGVDVDNIEYEDLILPYRTKSIASAERVTHRYWLSVDEVVERAQNGVWELTEDDLDILKGLGVKSDEEDGIMDSGLKNQKDHILGEGGNHTREPVISQPDGFKEYNRNMVTCFEVFLRDTPEGGERSEVIYQIIYPLKKIVRADFLDEKYPHGRRPFIVSKYIMMSNRWGALGLGDQLAGINMEVNTIFNFVNNNQALVTNPFFFFEPGTFTAEVDPASLIMPGQGIPVISVKGILMPTFQQLPLTNLEAMTSLLMFGDRLTISPLNAGSTQMKNAPRTARGTMAILGEGHVKTDMLITRLQETAWKELIEQVFGHYQAKCPSEKWYYITRDDKSRVPVQLSREMLRGRYEFSFKGNTVNTNREVLRSIAQVRYQIVMTHPDMQNDPVARRNALADFLKYWGDGADIDRLMPAAPGTGAYTHPPMSQTAENKIMEMGAHIEALPGDDHASHLQELERFQRSPSFGNMASDHVALFGAHMKEHQNFLRAQVAAQNMPVGAGQANNVAQQSPEGEPTGDPNATGVPGGGIQ